MKPKPDREKPATVGRIHSRITARRLEKSREQPHDKPGSAPGEKGGNPTHTPLRPTRGGTPRGKRRS
jgi:hypothetical protein